MSPGQQPVFPHDPGKDPGHGGFGRAGIAGEHHVHGRAIIPEELTLNMSYNQIKLRYSLNSLYSGTVNAVNSYMEQLGWGYHSYSEEKDAIKSDTVETIILYGFTAFIAASVYIMLSIMVLNNRIHQYKPVMQLLRRSGADKSVVFNILIRDCIWQNLYCIILMPVMLLIEAIIIRKNVT